MKNYLWVLMVILLAATNPSRGQHRDKIQEVFTAKAEAELGNGILGTWLKWGGIADMAGQFAAVSVGRINLIVCSLGTLDDRVVSFGILGCVIVR